MAYPLVKIANSTNHKVKGKVKYMSSFCSNDDYKIEPNSKWKAKHRGVCLLTEISADVEIGPNTFVTATSYKSSGTSYSNFAVIQTGEQSFELTRIVNGAKDEIPEDYIEPTEQQN